MLNTLIKKLLFTLNPEQAHAAALTSMQLAYRLKLLPLLVPHVPSQPCTVMGLPFPNRIGLAAGFDKNADYVDALAALGFGFIEVGTVTPKPQDGNLKPRLFRLTEQEAIINRMGFNNKGVDYVAERLEKTSYKGILGINIGKNRDTVLENSIDDYKIGFRALWKYASYITINISSPNTPGLRDLQKTELLTELLTALKQEQASVKRYVPLVVKISPDMTEAELHDVAQVLLQQKIDGVIATNTSFSRQGVETSPYATETGGLSGRPLQASSTRVIRQLHKILQGTIPIIGVGGIMDKASAQEKINAGAALLQIYTGFIYRGVNLVAEAATCSFDSAN